LTYPTTGSQLPKGSKGNDINAMLESFGFTSFKLTTAGQMDHLYEIVREDGSNAMSTLSEGEKSFITFLYFYNLIRGSHAEKRHDRRPHHRV
jgi:wobble nucleotide-excising tRNase